MRTTTAAVKRSLKPFVELDELVARLLQADPKIQEIIQFGSSVYMPECARDVDLIIITPNKRKSDPLWDATCGWPVNVDLIIKPPGEDTSAATAGFIWAAHRLWHGEGRFLKRVMEMMNIPTYANARKRVEDAREYLELAKRKRNWEDKIGHHLSMFDALFHGARYAAMAYLHTDETRWGEVKKGLPDHFRNRFEKIINVVHVQYAYDGRYPPDRVEQEYQRWRKTILKFIADLESASQASQSAATPTETSANTEEGE